MLLDRQLVEASIARAKRSRLNPIALADKIGDGPRSKFTTPEQRRDRFAQLLAESGNPNYARESLERLIGGNDLVSINYLARGTAASRSVCRIRLRNTSGDTVGFGTGFLVAPSILLTNHHVISNAEEAGDAIAEFDYELDLAGQQKEAVTFAILSTPTPIAVQALDFCLAKVADRSLDGRRALADFGWLPLNPAPGKTFIGEYLTIIQHPGGERKQICVRENKLLKYDEGADTLWYETDTVAGSSGSPVFNSSWQVAALHHSGVPKTDDQGHWLTLDGKVWDSSMDESQVAWLANEGIRVSRIMTYLQSSSLGNPIADAVLEQIAAPVMPSEARPVAVSDRPSSEVVDGELRVTIPVHVAVRVGDDRRPAPVKVTTPASVKPAAPPAPPVPLPTPMPAIESVNVDQSSYEKRPGFVEAFLGPVVALPEIRDAKRRRQVLIFKDGRKSATVLKYWNYSVVMNKARRLAFFSAVDVNANQRPTAGGRDGDRWYFDPRIDEEDQVGAEFYGEQSTFEADRSKNPFDKGHLTRRLDAQWGKPDTVQKRNGDDSFHWTNCSPQHWKFNQGAKKWLGLEDYVISTFAADTGKACVINGPVFDAPLSKLQPDGRIVPVLNGKSHPDPIFGDVAIPKQFFKIVACKRGRGKLAVAAFLISQEEFLVTMDRLKGMPQLSEKLTDAEARLYQVRVADIERLTGLDFGALSDAEVQVDEALLGDGIHEIREIQDVRFMHK